jgi:hypothetical protein
MARAAGGGAAAELLEAIAKGDAAAVGAILRAEAGCAAADTVCGEPATTPLLAAVKGEHTDIVSLLLDASADPDRVPLADPNGEPPGDSPLQHAAAEGFLVHADALLCRTPGLSPPSALPRLTRAAWLRAGHRPSVAQRQG